MVVRLLKILCDKGFQRSFVTQDLVESLALQPYTQKTINVSSFGTTCPTSHTFDTTIINLLTKSGKRLQLSVLVIPFIATPLQNTYHISVINLLHLHNLHLAHPITTKREFKISLLIGADHCWDIFGDHFIRGNGPMAVDSKVGYLRSGPVQSMLQYPAANIMMITHSGGNDFDLQCFWTWSLLECLLLMKQPRTT